jgi:1-acyl-sn-glycerol-3-phosphate acyltransferase
MAPFSRLVAHLRALARATVIAIQTVLAMIAVLLLAARASLFYVRSDGRPAVMRLWARSVAWAMGLRIVASGPLPDAPCLIVANHLSYIDIIVLGSLVPAVFVAKTEVARWPLLGPASRAAGTLFTDRQNRWRLPTLLAGINRILDTGGVVVLFPEGTSSDGQRVLPFRSAVLEPASAGGYRVFFAALAYRTPATAPPAREAVCWWGDMTLIDHLWRMLALRRITARVVFGRDAGDHADRRATALRLHTAVSEAHAGLLAGP